VIIVFFLFLIPIIPYINFRQHVFAWEGLNNSKFVQNLLFYYFKIQINLLIFKLFPFLSSFMYRINMRESENEGLLNNNQQQQQNNIKANELNQKQRHLEGGDSEVESLN